MRTRNGIEYNFKESVYHVTVDDLTFIFSSKLHVKKFRERYPDNRIAFQEKLSQRWGITCNVNTFADILLYQEVEKRGFLLRNQFGQFIDYEELKKCGVDFAKAKQ